MAKYEEHKFWCINCGRAGIPVRRKVGHQHAKNHRKKLWCPWCCMTINCVETKNIEQEFNFRRAFENGEFRDEAAQSLDYGRNTSLDKI